MNNYDQALNDAEIDILNAALATVKGGKIPNAEALDGFFAALACCPDFVLPSEYMEVIQRGETEDGDLVLDDMKEAMAFFALVSRHWNHVMGRLREGPVYLPLLLEDEAGNAHGNDWANGFLTGTKLRVPIWAPIIQDDKHGAPMVPIWALAYEHHPDPQMRPYQDPITPDQRERLMVALAVSTMQFYSHFLPMRSQYEPGGKTFRAAAKPGRNEPCPCGSGKKYKHCCGRAVAVH